MAKLGKPIKTFEVKPVSEPIPQPLTAPESTPAPAAPVEVPA